MPPLQFAVPCDARAHGRHTHAQPSLRRSAATPTASTARSRRATSPSHTPGKRQGGSGAGLAALHHALLFKTLLVSLRLRRHRGVRRQLVTALRCACFSVARARTGRQGWTRARQTPGCCCWMRRSAMRCSRDWLKRARRSQRTLPRWLAALLRACGCLHSVFAVGAHIHCTACTMRCACQHCGSARAHDAANAAALAATKTSATTLLYAPCRRRSCATPSCAACSSRWRSAAAGSGCCARAARRRSRSAASGGRATSMSPRWPAWRPFCECMRDCMCDCRGCGACVRRRGAAGLGGCGRVPSRPSAALLWCASQPVRRLHACATAVPPVPRRMQAAYARGRLHVTELRITRLGCARPITRSVDPAVVAADCQKRFATATTLAPLPGKHNPGQEVLVQVRRAGRHRQECGSSGVARSAAAGAWLAWRVRACMIARLHGSVRFCRPGQLHALHALACVLLRPRASDASAGAAGAAACCACWCCCHVRATWWTSCPST